MSKRMAKRLLVIGNILHCLLYLVLSANLLILLTTLSSKLLMYTPNSSAPSTCGHKHLIRKITLHNSSSIPISEPILNTVGHVI